MKTVSQFMNDDHALLDQLWQDFWQNRRNLEQINGLIAKFFQHFKRHVFFEDTVLFPRFNEHTGLDQDNGPVALLTRDHENLLKLLDRLKAEVEVGDTEKIDFVADNFGRLLEKHRERENQMGYPVLDSFITPEELEKIVIKIYKE